MSVWLRVPLGFFIVFVGIMMVWKTSAFQEWVGSIDWAEEKIGPGGTNTFLKLLGVVVVFIGIFTVTNIISDFLSSLASLFIRS